MWIPEQTTVTNNSQPSQPVERIGHGHALNEMAKMTEYS